MVLKHLPSESLPREKLLNRGSHALSDAELLAIFLRTGTKGMNVVQLADALLSDFGSLRSLFTASQEAFCQRKGWAGKIRSVASCVGNEPALFM